MDSATKLVTGVGAGMVLLVVGWIAYDAMPRNEEPVVAPPIAPEQPPEPPVVSKEPAKPVAQPTAGDSRRFDYKGDTPGVMTLQEFRFSRPTFDAEYDPSKVPGAVEVPGEDRFHFVRDYTIAGQDARVMYDFIDKTLCLILVSVDRKSMDIVTEALREKHGAPRITDDLYIWESDSSRIEAERSGTDIRFLDKKLMETLRERAASARESVNAAKKAAAAKDL